MFSWCGFRIFVQTVCYHSGGSSYYRSNHTSHFPHSLYLHTLTLLFYLLFCFLLRDIPVRSYRHIYQCACFHFFKIMITGPSICYCSLCTLYPFIPQHCHTTSVLPMPTPVLYISNTVAVHQLCRVPLSTHSSPNCAILRPVRQSIVSSCCLHNRHFLSVSFFDVLFLTSSVLLGLELPLLHFVSPYKGVEKIT